MKKKVLILTYDYPPFESVGGHRPASWEKYFPDFDIYPIIVTREWKNENYSVHGYISASEIKTYSIDKGSASTQIKAPYFPTVANKMLLKHGEYRFSWIRKTFSALDELGQYVFPIGAKRTIYEAADAFLRQERVDVIIATGDPFILFKYAADLSAKYHIPWIADYRDPWSHYLEKKNNWLYKFYRSQERRIVRSAAAITTVSEYIAEKLNHYFPEIPKHVIPNGYDPENVAKSMSVMQGSDILTIAHAGTIYDWHPLEHFLDTLSAWHVKTRSALRLVFYGLNQVDRLESYLETQHPELKTIVSWTPRLPNDQMLIELRKANVMLMFNYYAYMGTKIFDYIAIDRSILLCFENDPVAQDLKDKLYLIDDSDNPPQLQAEAIRLHQAGVVVQDNHDLIRVLDQLKTEFQETGRIGCNTVNKDHFSRKYQTERLATIIHSVTK